MRAVRPDVLLEEVVVKTSGDAFPARAIEEFGRIGVFVRDIDLKVLGGELDLAVHSLKDIPTKGLEGLAVACHLPRLGGHDILVAREPLEDLPEGARVGTSSARRKALLLRHRPDLDVAPIRGNVPTRVAKWRRGEVDALVLSKAGILRLGLDVPYHDLDPETFIPSPGQGVIAVTGRPGSEAFAVAQGVDDPTTRTEAEAERAVLQAVGGGCLVALGARARLQGGEIHIRAEVLSPDGRRRVARAGVYPAPEALEGARALAREILTQGGAELVDASRSR